MSVLECPSDTLSELAHYKHRWEQAEQECTKLKKEMRQMESFYTLTKGIPERMVKELRQKSTQIINLKTQLGDRMDLEPYFSTGLVRGETPTTQELFSNFHNMKEEISSILVTDGTKRPSIGSLYGHSDDLDELLRSIFDDDKQSQADQIVENLQYVTVRELVQALVGAAIHSWVFMSGYRPNSMTITPLLQRYRDHINTLCRY